MAKSFKSLCAACTVPHCKCQTCTSRACEKLKGETPHCVEYCVPYPMNERIALGGGCRAPKKLKKASKKKGK